MKKRLEVELNKGLNIIKNNAAWKDYLEFSARIYKYSFIDSVLIYGFDPKARMCADFHTWNKIGRRIKYGSRGIPITKNDSVSYVYDVRNTTGEENTIPKLWALQESNEYNSKFKAVLKNYVFKKCSKDVANINIDENVKDNFIDTVTNSVVFKVCKRCEIDIDYSFDLSFINPELIKDLGELTQAYSFEILRYIENSIKIQAFKQMDVEDIFKALEGVVKHDVRENRNDSKGAYDGTQADNVQRASGEGNSGGDNISGPGRSKEKNKYSEGTTQKGEPHEGRNQFHGDLAIQSVDRGHSLGDSQGRGLIERRNYRINEDDYVFGGLKSRYKNNVEAIKTLKAIEAAGRLATVEEQGVLSKYVGWGGMPHVFSYKDDAADWNKERDELKNLLSEDEYNAGRSSTMNAHYTSPEIIKFTYDALKRMGFSRGNILEPSMGIGNYFGFMPEDISGNSNLLGIEIDSITGRIAKQLYQNADIRIQGYENSNLPDNFFDLAVSNVPFGDYSVHDPEFNKYNFLIHDYFMAKTLDKVRPGGVIAFVTSKGTLDKSNNSLRKYIAERAELIGAVRLPNNAFKGNANTEVTTDIIFLKKSEQIIDKEPKWLNIGMTDTGVPVNQYFVDNPNMLLGKMVFDESMYGNRKDTALVPDERNLKEAFSQCLDYFPEKIIENTAEKLDKSILPADINIKNYAFCMVDNEIYQREGSLMKRVDVDGAAEGRIKGMIEIREAAKEVIRLQLEDYTENEIKAAQIKLNEVYDKFTSNYGIINSRASKLVFEDDPDYPLLTSLEVTDHNTNEIKKADIFSERIIQKNKRIEHCETSIESLSISLNETQLVFCDLSTPKDENSFDVYNDIKSKLVGMGVPSCEIAFIHDYDTDIKKDKLFSDVRVGKVRVLLGSTAKMGAGTNVQDKLIALHHIDAPWRPSDIAQREGRILRQGNHNRAVQIYRYVTESSFDAYMWQTLENKFKFISQIMKSDVQRTADDVDMAALSYAEVKAIASGNPLVMEKMEIDTEVNRLQILKSSYNSARYDMQESSNRLPKRISYNEKVLISLKEDLKTVSKYDLNKFEIELGGIIYTERADAGTALMKILSEKDLNSKLGSLYGLDIEFISDELKNYSLQLSGNSKYSVHVSDSGLGNVVRLENLVKSLNVKIQSVMNDIEQDKRQLEVIKVEIDKPFEHEEKLNSLIRRQVEINSTLDLDKKEIDAVEVGDGDNKKTVSNREERIVDKESSILSKIQRIKESKPIESKKESSKEEPMER